MKIIFSFIHSFIHCFLGPVSNYFVLRKVPKSIYDIRELKNDYVNKYKSNLQSNRRANSIEQNVLNEPAAPVAGSEILFGAF